MKTSHIRKRMPVSALFDPAIVAPAIGSAFVKLDPRTLIKNPVMFVLEVVTALTTIILGFLINEIGRASCREECSELCRSRWSPYH